MTRPRFRLYRSLYCAAFFFALFLPVGLESTAPGWVCEAYAAELGRSQSVTAPSSGYVTWVIDGDTVVLDNDKKVRYLGVDTPEQGEPFYEEALRRNKAIAGGRVVRLEVCKKEPYDKYGRLLAYVYADGVDISAILLREGLARPLMIPPCGLSRAGELKKAAATAKASGIGVWSVADRAGGKGVAAVEISPEQALEYIGRVATVTGKVFNVRETKKAVFINFGSDWRSAFTAMIFKGDLGAFKAANMDFKRYKGARISVTGRIKSYGERAEIIIRTPSQLKGD